MSIPATGWAVEQGCQHKLPTFARMLLVVLADILGRTGRLCPSIPYLAHRTGLSERTVRKFVDVLVQHGLIAAAKSVGNVTHYVLLRPDTPASLAGVTPVSLTRVNGADPGKTRQEPRQDTTLTPASLAAEPYRTKKEPKTRAEDARENPRLSDSLAVGRKSEAALPPAPPPTQPEREPTNAEIMANRQRHLDEIAAMPPALAAAVRSLANAFEPQRGPWRWPEHSVEEQQTAVAPPKVRPAFLAGAALAAARAAAGIRVTA